MTAPNQNREAPPASIKLEDIYYALFRRKWLVLGFWAVGIVAAGVIYFSTPPVYRSEAKLLVRYIRDAKAMDGVSTDSQVKSPGGGESIINSEVEILMSRDLARQVADTVGTEKILRNKAIGTNSGAAASLILQNLTVEVPKLSNIIKVSFQHPDPEIAQSVLLALIDAYLKKHFEVHRALGIADGFLSPQVDQLRQRLLQTEQELRDQRKKLGVLSVEDSLKAYADELTKLRQEILRTEAELGQLRTNQADAEKLAHAGAQTNATPSVTPQEKIDRYKAVCSELAMSRSEELKLRLRYTDQSPLVQQLRKKIGDLEQLKNDLEKEHASLVTFNPVNLAGSPSQGELMTEPARVAFLEVKLKVLNSQVEKLRAEAATLDEASSTIRALERSRDLAEASLKYFTVGLQQARIDEALDPRKSPNISRVQEPAAASPSPSGRTKLARGVLAGGFFGGIAIALILELLLDQSVRKVGDIATRLRVPVCLSIPDLAMNGHVRLSRRKSKSPRPSAEAETGPPAEAVVPWALGQPLRSYCDTLRDQLMLYFHFENLKHKPKLVGITSCGKASGVTTIAACLAQSLSETGDGSVLLVELNVEQGLGLSHFCHGKPGCTMAEILDGSALDSAAGQKGLFVVSADRSSVRQTMSLPQKLAGLMPKLKLSQLDYVIFDMPPVNLTSPTARLAGILDVTLLVLESEKTQRADVARALSVLRESDAKVLSILNRSRSYLPRWLEQRLPSS